MANSDLKAAKNGKNDEFYTQYHDIEIEMNAYLDFNPDVFRGKTVLLPCDDPEWSNFTRFFAAKFDELGLKKLISTSYAPESKKFVMGGLFSFLEQNSPQFDADKSKTRGKIFVLDRDVTGDGKINIDDLQWNYLQGDGDFRSDEVTALRDEADIIITNPPFSLFREFLAWVVEADKKFIIIGNVNAITYKEMFPLIKDNKVWLGVTSFNRGMYFQIPDGYEYASTYKFERERDGKRVMRVASICWFTNIDHGRRHEPLPLMTMADNLKFSKHKEIRGKKGYDHYDNYDAIEVPFADAIPSDYEGAMGVPITFLDKYCPEQFEILGITDRGNEWNLKTREYTIEDSPKYADLNRRGAIIIEGELTSTYARLLIRHIA